MKKMLSLDALAELARAYLESPWIAAPQWDKVQKRWVYLSPYGTGTSSCGAPNFTGIPKTKADIKPHQRVMWQPCKRCGLIRPWGGCARNSNLYNFSYTFTPGGKK